MIRTMLAVVAFCVMLAPPANAWNDIFNSVWGHKGNDTGGIIPWSPEAEVSALAIAQSNCSMHNKYARITSVNRHPGDYIAYVCQWDEPRGRRR